MASKTEVEGEKRLLIKSMGTPVIKKKTQGSTQLFYGRPQPNKKIATWSP